ncbi:MAG: carboxypeptidase-like regulatory domain-containing protein, partial [Opitutales bacterium]
MVEGVVLDSVTDAAVEGAAVFIGMSGGSGRTDASGVYTIEGVEPGVYDVRIFKSGFQLQAITGVNVGEEGRTRLNVALDPLGAPTTEGRRPDAPETEAPEELDEEDPSERKTVMSINETE